MSVVSAIILDMTLLCTTSSSDRDLHAMLLEELPSENASFRRFVFVVRFENEGRRY